MKITGITKHRPWICGWNGLSVFQPALVFSGHWMNSSSLNHDPETAACHWWKVMEDTSILSVKFVQNSIFHWLLDAFFCFQNIQLSYVPLLQVSLSGIDTFVWLKKKKKKAVRCVSQNKQWLRLKVVSFPLWTVLCNIQFAAYFHTVWNLPFEFQTLFICNPARFKNHILFITHCTDAAERSLENNCISIKVSLISLQMCG